MVRFFPKFYITLGVPGEDSIYIKDSNGDWIKIESSSYFRVYKAMNQMNEFEIHFSDIESTEKAYVKEQSIVLFFSDNTLILKGKIQKVKYETGYECIVTGNGMEIDILNKEYSNSTRNVDDPKRVEYSNVSAQTVANELLSTNSDGSSPWDMTPATTGLFDTDYGNITVRYEFANKLNCLGKLTEAIDYEWWIEVDSKDYDTHTFNIAPLQGTQTSVKTYVITGASTNCSLTSQEKDVTNMANKIEVLGYGDGVNQTRTSTYAASTTYSTLSADISSTASTISLADASSFDSTGTIRIAEEQITYAGKSSNDLTGCTRGVNSTTAKAHKKNVYTEKYVAIASAEASSPVGTYGILESTLTDTTIINEPTLELMASKELLNRMTPIVRISLIPIEPYQDVVDVGIGDKVTVTDAESDISGDFRIVAINYEDNYGNLGMEIQVSNRSLTFIEQMEKQREIAKNISVYAQGATNIYALSEKENCDNSKPVNMRFFIPTEAIAINKVLVKFKTQKFRAYTSTSAVNSAGTTIASAGSTNTNVDLNVNSWTTVGSITTANNDCDGVFLTHSMEVVIITGVTGGNSGTFRYRIYDGTNYYPEENSTAALMGGWMRQSFHRHEESGGGYTEYVDLDYDDTNFCLSGIVTDYIPGNQKNKTFTLQVKWDGFPNSWDWRINSTSNYKTISRHTHNMDLAINESTFPSGSPVVTVEVGSEGGESGVTGSPFSATDGGEFSADITSLVRAVGAGNWCNIKFTPGSGSDHNNLRIEANAYIQIFIESK